MNVVPCHIDNTHTENSCFEKFLGIVIDSDLKFDAHLESICTKVSHKLNALYRISCHMSQQKKRLLMKRFITLQFGYGPLVWMCHSRSLNNRINRLHDRALRLVYNDYHSTFDELLERDNSVSVHIKNLQILATEIYKFKNNTSPQIMEQLFQFNEYPYSFRREHSLRRANVKSVQYGTESTRALAPKIWDIVPLEIKQSKSLMEFKNRIKQWNPINCPCRLCKVYIGQVGFI